MGTTTNYKVIEARHPGRCMCPKQTRIKPGDAIARRPAGYVALCCFDTYERAAAGVGSVEPLEAQGLPPKGHPDRRRWLRKELGFEDGE